jgi:thiol-disulfide isomerase/thioredoxin
MKFNRTARRALTLVPAVAVALLLPCTARAQGMLCKPNYDYSVEVDGLYPKNATLYQASNPGMYFVDVPACKTGLLMDMKARKVVAVPRDLVKPVDGGLQLADGVPPTAVAYALAVDGPFVHFEAEDKKVRIVRCLDRPPIIGAVDLDTLVTDRPEYREGMKAYGPDAASIATIDKYGKKVQIDAFFATWCPHCKEYMPKFLRVMSQVKNPNIRLNLYGVPKGFGQAPGPWQGRSINNIPTVIVKVEGKEITRLGSQPGSVPEIELAGILNAVK